MIIENKRRQKNFLRKKHLRELRKLRVKERIGEQKDQIGFQMKQQEEALALEPDSITLMTFLSLSLSLWFLIVLLVSVTFFLIFSLVFVKDFGNLSIRQEQLRNRMRDRKKERERKSECVCVSGTVILICESDFFKICVVRFGLGLGFVVCLGLWFFFFFLK